MVVVHKGTLSFTITLAIADVIKIYTQKRGFRIPSQQSSNQTLFLRMTFVHFIVFILPICVAIERKKISQN